MSPIKVRILCVELAQSGWRGNGAQEVCHRLIGSFGRPIIPDPAGEAFLAYLARGEGENDRRRLRRIGTEGDVILVMKNHLRHECDALFSYDKGMIVAKA